MLPTHYCLLMIVQTLSLLDKKREPCENGSNIDIYIKSVQCVFLMHSVYFDLNLIHMADLSILLLMILVSKSWILLACL